MTTVLVAYASRHGTTQETAETIGSVLRSRLASDGVDIVVSTIGDADDVGAYDAYIIGSAVYFGRWLRAARQFVRREWPTLSSHPVWLFSVGPVGETRGGGEDDNPSPFDAEAMKRVCGHRIFPGRLDPTTLSLLERTVVRFVKAHPGDYRDPGQVRAWANEIADVLAGQQV
jgi:menaquinone-dependent protoporphyrinogen oxidase